MNFKYQAVTNTGEKKAGIVEAPNKDSAVLALQRRGLIVVSLVDEAKSGSILELSLFEKVPPKAVVIMSRQIATLFEAQVSALKAFSLLADSTENKLLAKKMKMITEDLQAGNSISASLAKHPDVFSDFFINMVKSGEESGKLSQTFSYLADYLDRQYALTAKTKNALIYPAFVIGIFITVMTLMFVFVIPKLSKIITESGQDIPFYTKAVIGISDFLVHYGIFVLIFVVACGGYVFYLTKTKFGKNYLDRVKLGAPIFGKLFTKVYLARFADNMNTMLSSGIPIVRAIEITSAVVGNVVYTEILKDSSEKVKSGSSLSDALGTHPQIPNILVQMIKVGEETGSLGNILKTLATFYKREVDDAVDTLVGLIEPLMIVALGLGVGTLLVSVLMPIYNIAGGIK